MESYYLALDPGDTSGWAKFNEDGSGNGFDNVHGKAALFQLLEDTAPSLIICEDYKLFPWKAANQSWSKLDTVRSIGAVEHYAWLRWGADWEKHIIYQDPKIKGVGYMWAGIPKPKAKSESHYADAYVHGVFYLQKNGIRKPQQGRGQ